MRTGVSVATAHSIIVTFIALIALAATAVAIALAIGAVHRMPDGTTKPASETR